MDYEVTSEIYTEIDYASTSKPKLNETNCVSTFKFKIPPKKPKTDKDGDLIVVRKPLKIHKINYDSIEIEHRKKTELNLVGLQMWRGSLLLADWLLYNSSKFNKDGIILELAGGVGFTSIVASMFSPVICTDVNKGDLMKIMSSNIRRNEKHVKFPVKTLELDFFTQVIPNYIVENVEKISDIIVAEVIYNDELTDAFIKTIEHLLINVCKYKTVNVYLAVEKRFVFTIDDCDSVAPCFEYFLRQIRKSRLRFEELPIDFPQYFEYDRVKQLVLGSFKLKDNL